MERFSRDMAHNYGLPILTLVPDDMQILFVTCWNFLTRLLNHAMRVKNWNRIQNGIRSRANEILFCSYIVTEANLVM